MECVVIDILNIDQEIWEEDENNGEQFVKYMYTSGGTEKAKEFKLLQSEETIVKMKKDEFSRDVGEAYYIHSCVIHKVTNVS